MKKIKDLFISFQDKLATLSPVQKVLVFAGTLLIMGGAFYFLEFQNQMETLDRLRRQIGEQKTKLASLKAAEAKIKVVEKELAQSEEELARLLMLLPDQKEIPGLLENVSRIGSKVGLENILFQPQPEVLQQFYAIIPIRLDLLGSFNDLGVFLDSISKLDRILKVESLTLTRQKDNQTPLLQVGCNIVTYRFLEKPMPKKPGEKK
ncbi:MAG TPA: type 4a pilus biogenesis protein PilO [Syntrophobacteraceae bacterium]|nr:type 4a pilus biogenesis protein PilO [Syntrophobacteraceae bacterium]